MYRPNNEAYYDGRMEDTLRTAIISHNTLKLNRLKTNCNSLRYLSISLIPFKEKGSKKERKYFDTLTITSCHIPFLAAIS